MNNMISMRGPIHIILKGHFDDYSWRLISLGKILFYYYYYYLFCTINIINIILHIFIYVTLPSLYEMLCPQIIKCYVFVLAYDALLWFFILELVMVEDIRWYDLLSIEKCCHILKGPDNPNSIFCGFEWYWLLFWDQIVSELILFEF